jgi:methyl-accepting chemotaxis protein
MAGMRMKLSIRFKLALLAVVPLFLYTFTSFILLNEQRTLFNDVSEQVYDTGNAIQELILNADRDMYQAYVAYLKIESGALTGEQLNKMVADLQENLQQVEDRMGEAMGLISANHLGELQHGSSGKSVEQLMEEFKAGFTSWRQAALAAQSDGQSVFANEAVDSSFFSSRTGIDEIDENIDAHVKATMEQISNDLRGSERILITY